MSEWEMTAIAFLVLVIFTTGVAIGACLMKWALKELPRQQAHLELLERQARIRRGGDDGPLGDAA